MSWIGATELVIEGHRLLAAALLEEEAAELLGHFRIPETVALPVLESVLVQNLCPEVAVVAGTVTAAESVVEIRAAVTRDNLVDKTHFTADILLKRLDVKVVPVGVRTELVPLHVKDRRSAKLSGHEALVELGGIVDLGHERIRDNLTST